MIFKTNKQINVVIIIIITIIKHYLDIGIMVHKK